MAGDPLVRNGDPHTSTLAADKIRLKQGTIRWRVLEVYFLYGEMTDWECNKRLDNRKNLSSLRTRRKELGVDGMMEWTGRTVEQDGTDRQVWRITDAGKQAYILGRTYLQTAPREDDQQRAWRLLLKQWRKLNYPNKLKLQQWIAAELEQETVARAPLS